MASPEDLHERADQVHPRRVADPGPVVQRHPGPARTAATAAAPGHGAAGRAGRPGPAVPDGTHSPGGHRRPVRRHPRRGHRRLQALAPDAPVPRPAAGAAAEHAGQDLLQVRGRLPRRVAQAEHRGPAGLLQLGRGHQAAHHRDRRGPVGQRPGVRLGAVRPRLRGLDGPRLLRPETAPADDDADLGRDRAPVAVAGHPGGPEGARRLARFPRVAGNRDLGGGRGGGRVRRDAVRARLGPQPRAHCTRRSSGRRRWSSSPWPARTPGPT